MYLLYSELNESDQSDYIELMNEILTKSNIINILDENKIHIIIKY